MRRLSIALAALGVVASLVLVGAGPASASSRFVCSGDPANPGVLAGTYPTGVDVKGFCVVGGPTTVDGKVVVTKGSALVATDADFTANGNVQVRSGGTLVGGPVEEEGAEPAPGILFHVTGNLDSTHPLGVVIHEAAIDGNVTETGGGGGFTCDPIGIFAEFQSPVFSVYAEGTHIGGKLTVTGVTSCWLGVTHSQIDGGIRILHNQLADPDAIEILDNHIGGNLVCQQNSMMWDSADILEDALYPRQWEPNVVGGTRVGQCVEAPPLTPGGSSPGPF
jgi:hypothetical protein